MLGRFLEFSCVTPDIGASLAFYRALGFSEAQCGDAWTHPYAVVTDGRLCVGLHQRADFRPGITFVLPDLLRNLDALEKLAVNLEFRRLGNDVFNELGWFDPSGHLIRLVEARTFSPGKGAGPKSSLCGYFQEIGLPAPHGDLARAYWERCGFVGIEEPDGRLPHVSCTSDSIDIGLYEPKDLAEPTLVFEVVDAAATITRLDAAGIAIKTDVPQRLRRSGTVRLTAPEGTDLLLCQA